MESMTLEQAYFAAQILGVLAVIWSLIYVGIQLKQTKQAIRLSMVESVIQQFREHEALVCQSADVAEILWKGMRDPTTLEGPDRMRFYQLCNYYYKSFENAYFKYRDGALSGDNWVSIKHFFIDIGHLPGMRKYWDDRKHWFGADFQEMMAREIISAHPHPGYKFSGEPD